MPWHKRGIWKAGIAIAGILLLLLLMRPTGYATSEPREGKSPEKRAKTAEMWLPERKPSLCRFWKEWKQGVSYGTDISLVGHHAVAAMSTNNHLPAFRTLRRLIARWVLELLEIILICCHIHIVLGVEAFTARFAGLPATSMTLMIVIGTERVAIVIAPTAIAGIRKQHIRVAIIAYPVVTTKRFG